MEEQNGLEQRLIRSIQDAHAVEQTVKRLLDSQISATDDPEIRRILVHHRQETERHERLLRERLEAHGADVSRVRDYAAIGGAMLKGLTDRVRSDKPVSNARDAFVTEQFEIASYELLERIAKRCGDDATAEVARRNREDEQAMARKISKHWDRFVDQTVARWERAVPA